MILLDYEMPGMDGKETFEAIQENNDMKSIPAGYILKPPDRDKLLDTIEDVFKEKNV